MEAKIEKTKVYNVIILDRSGSMWSIKKQAIGGYNEVLGGVKEAAKKYSDTQEHYFTLVLFDGEYIDNVYWNEEVSKASRLTDKTYIPGASTPLYDAIGRTITKLESELKDDSNTSVVVTIITDGYENSSKEYSHSAVKRLINHAKVNGWSFAYMGTDHDVDKVTVSLSISNTVKFAKTEEDTDLVFKRERRARERYFEGLNDCVGLQSYSKEERREYNRNLANNYYKEDNEK